MPDRMFPNEVRPPAAEGGCGLLNKCFVGTRWAAVMFVWLRHAGALRRIYV
jgi:hypothetical protein